LKQIGDFAGFVRHDGTHIRLSALTGQSSLLSWRFF
jgi:hypothetical protein